jgi:hypothetical protein
MELEREATKFLEELERFDNRLYNKYGIFFRLFIWLWKGQQGKDYQVHMFPHSDDEKIEEFFRLVFVFEPSFMEPVSRGMASARKTLGSHDTQGSA